MNGKRRDVYTLSTDKRIHLRLEKSREKKKIKGGQLMKCFSSVCCVPLSHESLSAYFLMSTAVQFGSIHSVCIYIIRRQPEYKTEMTRARKYK